MDQQNKLHLQTIIINDPIFCKLHIAAFMVSSECAILSQQ